MRTIKVSAALYYRLARIKSPSESFSQAIARVLDTGVAHTAASAVRDTAAIWGRTEIAREADQIELVVRATRSGTPWQVDGSL
jgi:hypothetical protein